MTDGYGNMVLGYYGKTPVPPDPEIVKIASEQMKKPVFTGDPIKDLEPGIPKARKVLEENGLPVSDENLFIIGALATKGGNKGLDFLKGNFKISVPKKDPNKPVATPVPAAVAVAAAAPAAPVAAPGQNGKSYRVSVSGKSFDLHVQPF
jgi:pyruvate carboxylase subunit B